MNFQKYKRIFLVAMDYEIENIFAVNKFTKAEDGLKYVFFENGDNGLIKTGMSKTMAAGAAQWAIDTFNPQRWVNVGLCGSLNKRLSFGETVVVESCRFHDVDVRGLFPECKIGQTAPEYTFDFILNTELAEQLPRGKCISGDRFVTDQKMISEIKAEYNPDLVEMEITAIAQIMERNGQLDRLSAIKVISDNADTKAGDNFIKAKTDLFLKAQKVVGGLLV